MYLRYIGSVPTDTIRTQFKTQSWYTAIQQNLIQKSAIQCHTLRFTIQSQYTTQECDYLVIKYNYGWDIFVSEKENKLASHKEVSRSCL